MYTKLILVQSLASYTVVTTLIAIAMDKTIYTVASYYDYSVLDHCATQIN